jgi:hypothetical protein
MTDNPKSAIENPKLLDSGQRAGESGQSNSMSGVRDQRLLLALAATLLLVLCVHAEAQAGTIPRIGYLSNRVRPNTTTPDLFEDAFRQGLHNLGYIEGKNILIDYRYAGGAGRAPSTSCGGTPST